MMYFRVVKFSLAIVLMVLSVKSVCDFGTFGQYYFVLSSGLLDCLTFHVCVLHFEAKLIRDWRIAINENTLSIAFRSKNRIGKLQWFSSGAVVYILVFSFIFRHFGVTTSKEIILRTIFFKMESRELLYFSRVRADRILIFEMPRLMWRNLLVI